jgi:hypothetical protein
MQLDKSILKTTKSFVYQAKRTDNAECEWTAGNYRLLSETDLNKSSILMHDYEKQPTQSDLTLSDPTSKLPFLGHTSISIVLGSWFDRSVSKSVTDQSFQSAKQSDLK